MTKQELVAKLANWPDDAQVEVSVHTDDDDVIWFELTGVESVSDNPVHRTHCLLYTGAVTMG